MNKKLCSCGNIAVWVYMSGSELYCDDCVPRGCFCNYNYTHQSNKKDIDGCEEDPPLDQPDSWKWIEEGISWQYVDKKGRVYPCCEYMYDEYMYDENGWEE